MQSQRAENAELVIQRSDLLSESLSLQQSIEVLKSQLGELSSVSSDNAELRIEVTRLSALNLRIQNDFDTTVLRLGDELAASKTVNNDLSNSISALETETSLLSISNPG